MIVLTTAVWPALAASLVLGMLVGGLAGLPKGALGWAVVTTLAVILGILVGLAFAQRVPGVGGLWVDTAALMLGVYLAGCALGGLAARLILRTG